MHIYQSDLLVFLLASFLCGMLLSALYDAFRVCRLMSCGRCRGRFSPDVVLENLRFLSSYNAHRKKKGAREDSILFIATLFLCDILYFSLVALIVVLLFYGYNWGKSRLFSVLGLIGGFVLWRITCGNLILLLFEYLFYVLGALLYFTFFPFRILFLKIKKVIYKPLCVLYNKYKDVKIAKDNAKTVEKEVAFRRRMKPVGNNPVVMEKK